MHERLHNASDKLVAAFLTDSIEHENCRSCAVGNLCDGDSAWTHYHSQAGDKVSMAVAEEVILATGYSVYEIYQIEKVFEFRKTSLIEYGHEEDSLDMDEIDNDGFFGLCNVFDYLISIEDFSDEESKVNLVEMCLQNN